MNKIIYIEKLRVLATLAVVMFHIVWTLPNNYSIDEIGIIPYTIMCVIVKLTDWAVPIFVMITGALLLSPKKELENQKLKKYCIRILVVLFSFGTAYSMLELIMNNDFQFSILMFPHAMLNVFEQKSWDHLWYLYLLLVLYILTPLLKSGLNYMKDKDVIIFIVILCICSFVIPTINSLFRLEIVSLPIVSYPYFAYYLLGYWFAHKMTYSRSTINYIIMFGFISIFLIVIADIVSIYKNRAYSMLVHEGNIFTFSIVCAVFIGVKTLYAKSKTINHVEQSISKTSFAIYLVHPFYINLIYKGFHITPIYFSVGIGILILYMNVLFLSWITGFILKRILIVKDFI